MTELIVGDDDCPYKKVVGALLSSETSVVVANGWRELARELNVEELTIRDFHQRELTRTAQIYDILHGILVEWRLRVVNNATLDRLISCVSSIGWRNVAENLRVTFTTEESHTLEVKDILPPPISYYVSRRLTTRSLLNPEIFNEKSNDIFVYYGKIERHQVTQLANGSTTDTSRNQVFQANLSENHILLDQFGDWGRLRKKSYHPIHLINCDFDENKFRWVHSKGDMGLLQRFVAEKQDEYSEDKFQEYVLDKVISPLRRNLPVIIADSPGMGKSVLLSQIGRSLKDANQQIIFIVTGDFVKNVQKKLKSRLTETLSGVLESLANYFCDPNYALHSLQMMTSSESHESNTKLELLFDGFDEIDENDFELAYECLSMLSKIKCIRLWVTTRPHLLQELEQRLKVLGYNIIPFTRTEQESFLKMFWSQKENLSIDKSKLHRFINECLDKINSLLQASENQYIAGIPLQCMLLAEAFQREALEFADLKNEQIDAHNNLYQVEIKNITDLYEGLISNRFQKYFQTFGAQVFSTEEETRLKQIHVYFAIKLIFPQCHVLLENLWRNMGNTTTADLLNIGILEADNETEPPRFIHRTVGEYFISWFLADQLSSTAKYDQMLEQLIYLVLETYRVSFNVLKTTWEAPCHIDTYKFKRAGMCHFMNWLLAENGKFPSDDNENVIKALFSPPDENRILQILHAGLNSNCFYICKLLYQIIPHIWDNPVLMMLTVWRSTGDFLQFLYSSLGGPMQQLCQFDFQDMLGEKSALHLGLLRGDYNIVEYLLLQHGFSELVKSSAHSMRNILHHCVRHTSQDSPRQIKERIDIMKLLLLEDKQLLHYKNVSGKYPILRCNIHVDLLIELVKLEANLLERDICGATFLHIAADHLSGDDLLRLLKIITPRTLKVLAKSENNLGETILHRVVCRPGYSVDVVKWLLKSGADPKAQTKQGLSALAFALKYEVNMCAETIDAVELLAPVLEVGEIVNDNTNAFTYALHQAASVGNLRAVEYLIDTKQQDVNSRNSEGKTVLESTVCGIQYEFERYDVAKSLTTRGAILDYKSEGYKLLHDRILKGDHVGIRILLELCNIDTNAKSDSECTALHLAFEADVNGVSRNRTLIFDMLLTHGANVNSENSQGESPLMFAIGHRPKALNFDVFSLLVEHGTEMSEKVAHALLFWLCAKKRADLSNPKTIKYMNQFLKCSKSIIPVTTEVHNPSDGEKKYVIDYLLLHGWNINSVDGYGRSLLHYAVLVNRGHRFLRYLMNHGVNLQLKTNRGSTLLHTAVSIKNLKALAYFLKLGKIDINAKDENGDTPLHRAVIHKTDIMLWSTRLLLKNGADSTVVNNKGETPRDVAVRLGVGNNNLVHFDAKRCLMLEGEKQS